jgi:hypothetical protein
MNTLTFEVRKSAGDGPKAAGVIPVVDGRALNEHARAVELAFASAEGHAEIAGAYAGLWSEYMPSLSGHFLGTSVHPVYQSGGKTHLLDCECGAPGCWPLMCRINATSDFVTWSDFEQPHRRSGDGSSGWDYSTLGPFTFEREAYEAAIAELAGKLDS